MELLELGLSVRKTAKYLGYNNYTGLNACVNRWGLRWTEPGDQS